MVGNISYFQCGKVWRNCSQSFVKFCWLLLIIILKGSANYKSQISKEYPAQRHKVCIYFYSVWCTVCFMYKHSRKIHSLPLIPIHQYQLLLLSRFNSSPILSLHFVLLFSIHKVPTSAAILFCFIRRSSLIIFLVLFLCFLYFKKSSLFLDLTYFL